MKRLIFAVVAVAAVITSARLFAQSAHAAPAPDIKLVSVQNPGRLNDLAGLGYVVRAATICPMGVPDGIYGGAVGNGSPSYPVGCVIMQRN